MPVAMISGGATYYLAYDQVGSLRMVADSAGNIVKQVDYDTFGNILNDSNLGFTIPFGFAGGLHDRDTGLVRFGYRDYMPEIGKWTAKDPILFAGGDSNLYGYVMNDPVNFIDPEGLEIRVYSSDAFGVKGLNHAFVWSTETQTGKGTNGSSGQTLGDGVGDINSPYEVITLPKGMTDAQFMDAFESASGWNNGMWFPWVNDCHTDSKNAAESTGANYPGAPNGRVDIDDNVQSGINNIMQEAYRRLMGKIRF